MGVPPYLVLPNSALRAVAEAQPRSRDELARIRGVGPRTLAKFGDDLLRLADSVRPEPLTDHLTGTIG